MQFVLNAPAMDSGSIKKVEPPPKQVKKAEKSDPTTDLLSLFQKAIENVNDDEPVGKAEQEYLRPRPQPVTKPRRAEDP